MSAYGFEWTIRDLTDMIQDGGETRFKDIKEDLRKKYDVSDEYWLGYWAIRIMVIEAGCNGAEAEINFDGLPDPRKVTIEVYPDYGS